MNDNKYGKWIEGGLLLTGAILAVIFIVLSIRVDNDTRNDKPALEPPAGLSVLAVPEDGPTNLAEEPISSDITTNELPEGDPAPTNEALAYERPDTTVRLDPGVDHQRRLDRALRAIPAHMLSPAQKQRLETNAAALETK